MRELHVTSPLMRGADVLAVQKKLKELGYTPGPLDAQYGTATAAAVKEFQHDHQITADGIVGGGTLAVLNVTVKPKPPVGATKGLAFVYEAVKHIGTKESPAGSNRQEFGVWFGVNGVPWCNEFVSYCTAKSTNFIICNGISGAGVVKGKGCAYVPTTEAWLRTTGQWIGRVMPQNGDIGCFNWNGGVPDHIGFGALEETLRHLCLDKLTAAIHDFGPLSPGEFWSIEGNTGIGNDSNGGEVMLRQRSLMLVDGFGRIR